MKKITVIVIGLLLMILGGCSESNRLQIKLSTPRTFTPGSPYLMQIKVLDKQGKPVTGAKVSVNLKMKNMDHGTIPVTVEKLENGKYIGTANISMGGDWLADIKVKQDRNTFEFEKQFSVEVKTKENAHQVTQNVSLPEFNLIDENGKPITKQDLLGKTVVMTFTYVNCADPNACPVLLGNFSNLQNDIKKNGVNSSNLLLVSISIDPENDTPAALKEHAQKMNFDMSYLKMLTGDLNEIKKLSDKLGEHFKKQGPVVMHDNKTFIFNSEGNLTHEFTGSYIDRDELIQVVTTKK